MANVFPHATIVLTVTGTILMESIFAQKPVASLGTREMARYIRCQVDLAARRHSKRTLRCSRRQACTASQTECRHLLQTLHSSSYPATVWDPISQSHMATSENIESLIKRILGRDINSYQQQQSTMPSDATEPNDTRKSNATNLLATLTITPLLSIHIYQRLGL